MNSGFHYRLKLPALLGTRINESLRAKVNVLDLSPIRVQLFKTGFRSESAFAQISEHTMLLLSLESELKMGAELVTIDKTLLK